MVPPDARWGVGQLADRPTVNREVAGSSPAAPVLNSTRPHTPESPRMPPSAVAQHPLDEISLGLIVQIRERLLKAQAAGKKVYRLESGGPNVSRPPPVLEAGDKAGAAG